jgi:hypothetical protein
VSNCPDLKAIRPEQYEEIRAALLCAVCRENVSNPVKLPCFHIYCESCITDVEANQKKNADLGETMLLISPGSSVDVKQTGLCHVCVRDDSGDDSELFTCSRCHVTVHAACYGIQNSAEGKDWQCQPCAAGHDPDSRKCCICPNQLDRALTCTKDERWIHTSCAIWMPGLNFEYPDELKSVINFEAIHADRYNLKCKFCKKKQPCLQCTFPTCHEAYHIPCAFRNGVRFEQRWPRHAFHHEDLPIYFHNYCTKHHDKVGEST